ncbi:DUF2382 domain-containing protein [Umezakia ovalisporum]|jgi:uncharacterized protein (TIGR02271 family)|uniref:DUF2382 domain-containing protein n=2 Tax=Umezakia ovalisporum TaxID=75695 RepID=A0AA43GZM5_9CYAN|nr:DUF2382 domain-containing protein [Umezakia ovalisporum]MBI1242566.1 DUF2382 domain-containing protein [Nostoc sp. RI_552]MDH6056321.1 DUF2382 domain-containing protein [Umezakia ovalisporum FSS-43]MDH6064328.1 DUF2382 domain-containing protein [Umezakia ovalisporum FSS-62]MDH6068840.1 DUF2382 domain-containing protein [Umezakia ovalisporum APH033B]MDH6071030.1 DUF2382 domain-containing protein [Umezakia ovalisporum CobakiLakeA]
MSLHKLADFAPNYHENIQGKDIKGLGVYTDRNNEKIGTVSDVLVDEEGRFRYLVVDLGFWIFGKKVLLPVGRSRIDYDADRVYVIGLTREQAENLPEFQEARTLDYDYEEQVRRVYRDTRPVEPPEPTYTRETYTYEQEPSLYRLNQQDHQTLRLYEERLIANKRREKTGEVAIGKHVESETAKVSVPIEKEHVVIERITPEDAGKVVPTSEADFREGEVARIEIHEETPEVRKEVVLREEVKVQKVVEQEIVETQDTVRREELDVNAPNLPVEER